jgi:hypothetical protein
MVGRAAEDVGGGDGDDGECEAGLAKVLRSSSKSENPWILNERMST